MKRISTRSIDAWIVIVMSILGLALIYAGIMHGPMIGMADNGDFLRVMKTAGIDYATDGLSYDDKYFRYALFQYANVPLSFGGYVSTHLLFLFAAKAVNVLGNGPDSFHIASLSVVYALIFAAAVSLIYSGLEAARSVKVAVAALLTAIYTDIAYTAYYHSFYSEPVSLLGFLLAIGFGLHAPRGGKLPLFGYFAAIFILVGAKSQNFPLGIVFVAGLLPLYRTITDVRWRRAVVAMSAAALLFSFAVYAAAPKELKRINVYQTVFFGILKHSGNVEADLREMDLPAKLAPLAGTNFFEKGTAIPQTSPQLNSLFYDRISHLDAVWYYTRHPLRLMKRLQWAAEHSTTIRPYYLGSYEQSEGREAGAVHLNGGWWSEWKKEYVPRHVSFAAALSAVFIALLSSRRVSDWSGLRAPAVLYSVPCVAVLAYMTPIIGDGDADLAKHLFLYNVAFDFMVLLSAGVIAGCAVNAALEMSKRLRRAPEETV